jgi:transcriptional regulator with XRE-family HTH domain
MLGVELPKAREEAELTQEELSFAAMIDRSYISPLERNLKSPTVDTLFLICDALQLRASELISGVKKSRKRAK